MPAGPGAFRNAWYQWKMKRFPWRKKWLVGFDLQGNTFWEFRDALHALRTRRIAQYSRSTHYGDVKVSPSWMQWLRHTRFEPPTVAEQQQDLVRQERMKTLAAQADARWASKPSALDALDKQQPVQMLQSRDPDSRVTQMNANEEKRDQSAQPQSSERGAVRPPAVVPEVFQELPRDSPVPPTDTPSLATRQRTRKEPKDSPWNQPGHGNPGQDWQPQSWSPMPAKRRA